MSVVIIRKIRRFNMKIKDAIKQLNDLRPSVIDFVCDSELNEAIDIAIEALEEKGKEGFTLKCNACSNEIEIRKDDDLTAPLYGIVAEIDYNLERFNIGCECGNEIEL